jgi:hypothetical protein
MSVAKTTELRAEVSLHEIHLESGGPAKKGAPDSALAEMPRAPTEHDVPESSGPAKKGALDSVALAATPRDVEMQAPAPLYYASLQEAWYEPPMPGVDDLMVSAGWSRLHWCSREDWVEADWCDQWHSKAHKAAQFLNRLMHHVPHTRVLIVGDSTLTWDLGERGEHGFSYNWEMRDTFLRTAGCPSCALWAVPGQALHGPRGLLSQLRNGVRYGGTYEAVLLVGGWNESSVSAEDFVRDITQAAQEACRS